MWLIKEDFFYYLKILRVILYNKTLKFFPQPQIVLKEYVGVKISFIHSYLLNLFLLYIGLQELYLI